MFGSLEIKKKKNKKQLDFLFFIFNTSKNLKAMVCPNGRWIIAYLKNERLYIHILNKAISKDDPSQTTRKKFKLKNKRLDNN